MEEVCKINEFWSGMTIQELNAIKEDYKKTLNASGEVSELPNPHPHSWPCINFQSDHNPN